MRRSPETPASQRIKVGIMSQGRTIVFGVAVITLAKEEGGARAIGDVGQPDPTAREEHAVLALGGIDAMDRIGAAVAAVAAQRPVAVEPGEGLGLMEEVDRLRQE